MKEEEAKKIIEETDADFSIKNSFVRGLNILSKYEDIDPYFEHDMGWFGSFETVEKMTKEEVIELAKCGFFEDEESWAHF